MLKKVDEKIDLLPVKEKLEENQEFHNNPLLQESLNMSVNFYKKVGFVPPWICYYAAQNGAIVGCAGFTGKPVNGTIEIAYGTLPAYQHKGIGTAICKKLVEVSLESDPSIKIKARTLAEKSFSTRILEKNNFIFSGVVHDPEDGELWEWVFREE